MTTKLVAVTYASDMNNPILQKLIESSKYWGWDLRVLTGQWSGFKSKLSALLEQLPKFRDEGITHTLFTDAYDVVCVGPPAEALKYCDDKLVLSAEVACWPDSEQSHRYPKRAEKGDWRFVNSGGYMGPIDLIEKVLSERETSKLWSKYRTMPDFDRWLADDQMWLTLKYLNDYENGPGEIWCDTQCKVFQTIGHVVVPWTPWEVTFDKLDDGRLHNKITNTHPCFVHANGGPGTPLQWLYPLKYEQ
jgi:hypothetical protein